MAKAASVLKYVFLVFPQFCLGHGLVELVTNQFQYQLLSRFGQDTYASPYQMEMLGWKYVALAAEGFLFILLNFFVHTRKRRAIRYRCFCWFRAVPCLSGYENSGGVVVVVVVAFSSRMEIGGGFDRSFPTSTFVLKKWVSSDLH